MAVFGGKWSGTLVTHSTAAWMFVRTDRPEIPPNACCVALYTERSIAMRYLECKFKARLGGRRRWKNLLPAWAELEALTEPLPSATSSAFRVTQHDKLTPPRQFLMSLDNSDRAPP
jgi:hypothetical protein